MTDLMIEAIDVRKKFNEVTALDGVTLRVPRGTVTGLLGHNGAGKTTLVNILATLLPADGGTVRVAGFDVAAQGRDIRRRIGLTGQFAAVDEQLSGLDNLILIARLLGASRRDARVRGTELIELFDLRDAATRPVHTYSGGMRRRLDIAASIVGQPEVLFLDEPTTGLDPVSRIGVWEIIEALVAHGTTVLLTTQYLEEADRLADSITVLFDGKTVVSGTPGELKATVGQRTARIDLGGNEQSARAVSALEQAGMRPSFDAESGALTTSLEGSADLATVVRELDEAGIAVSGLTLSTPSLDDVYLTLSETRAAAAGSREKEGRVVYQ